MAVTVEHECVTWTLGYFEVPRYFELKLVVLQFPNLPTKHCWELLNEVMEFSMNCGMFSSSRGSNMQHPQVCRGFTPQETTSISSFQHQEPSQIHLP